MNEKNQNKPLKLLIDFQQKESNMMLPFKSRFYQSVIYHISPTFKLERLQYPWNALSCLVILEDSWSSTITSLSHETCSSTQMWQVQFFIGVATKQRAQLVGRAFKHATDVHATFPETNIFSLACLPRMARSWRINLLPIERVVCQKDAENWSDVCFHTHKVCIHHTHGLLAYCLFRF